MRSGSTGSKRTKVHGVVSMLTLMLPTGAGMASRKVRIEGLTSSICLMMTVWSDCWLRGSLSK